MSAQLFAQEIVLMDLTSNPTLINKSNELRSKGLYRSASVNDTIELDQFKGILDDFSYQGPYPDSSIWLDKYVFINRTYAYCPPTLGVATFDGLNANGYPYDFTADQYSSRGADSLTSKPINLTYLADDSVYFSFYYQPQGLGNSPAKQDSLVLEFKAPGGSWDHIWSKAGSALVFKDTLKWGYVHISITDSKYLKKGFQFRIRNYATVSGSLDHWHIDYVYLNKSRKSVDDIDDVSYVYNCPSLIKKYQEMPWRHYTTDYSRTSVVIPFRVNSFEKKNVKRKVTVTDKNAVNFANWEDNDDIQPFSVAYTLDTAKPIQVFPTMNAPATYYEQAALTGIDKVSGNDTLRRVQKFGDYFAYDDGTAESAFGLNAGNASLALKFELAVSDTLRYVDIYFNPILINAEKLTFNIRVWGDGTGQPGAELFTSGELKPVYTQTGLNGFVRYPLGQAIRLPAGISYVGVFQPDNIPLGIGRDLNTNSQLNTFYDVGSGWNTFPYPGTAMIRPVFGTDSTIIGISEIQKPTQFLKLYPNPATTILHVVTTNSFDHQVAYTIFDLYGRAVSTGNARTPMGINIEYLSKGIYFIRFIENNNSSTLKFIKEE